MSEDLVAFLRARLDEDEVAVRHNWNASTGLTDERWWLTPFQPSRALREVEAKRAILGEYEGWRARGGAGSGTGGSSISPVATGTLLLVLRRLAAVYRDHPDYNPGWKP